MSNRRVSFFCITEPCWPTFLYLSFNHSLEQSGKKNRRHISTMSSSFMCLLVANLISYCWRTSLERSLSSESIYQWQFITAFSMTMWRSRFRLFLHLASHLEFWGQRISVHFKDTVAGFLTHWQCWWTVDSFSVPFLSLVLNVEFIDLIENCQVDLKNLPKQLEFPGTWWSGLKVEFEMHW